MTHFLSYWYLRTIISLVYFYVYDVPSAVYLPRSKGCLVPSERKNGVYVEKTSN